jgi:transcriptional regulatory protein RtcR
MLLKAVEEKRFLPFGSDKEVKSEFQLIAGTNRDLKLRVAEGIFREDLYARINLWTFDLPGLADRPEDIEPNIEFELTRFASEAGRQVRFNVEARRRYLEFATSVAAPWSGNFRELSASITRMATLAAAGRITEDIAAEEIERLQQTWSTTARLDRVARLLGEGAEHIDLFDRVQLDSVLAVCSSCKSLSEAGRALFAASRQEKKQTNDADRLRKYLARFNLSWEQLREV